MASGATALRKIQIGEEATKGAPVAATTELAGLLTMKNVPTIHRPREERGSLAEFQRSIKVAELAEMELSGDVTFEQILYLLHMGVAGDITPSVVDTSGKKWTFAPSLTTPATLDSFTLRYGDDVQAWYSGFCMASEIVISGALEDTLKMVGTIFGHKMTAEAFTGGQSVPTIESVPTANCRLYIDDEDGTIGTTVKSATLIELTYTIRTGLAPRRYADGAANLLLYSGYKQSLISVELTMTFAFNSGVEAERLKFDGATQRLIRIRGEGSLVGAVDQLKTLDLDVCGIWTAWETLSERDGEDIVAVTLSSEYGANYAKLFEVVVVNAVATLP